MSGFLLDTNVVSIFYRTLAPSIEAWLRDREAVSQLFLSSVTIHEIEKGICLLEHRGATAKAGGLRLWLQGLLAGFSPSILSVDAEVAKISGQLEAMAVAAGQSPGGSDALIAGTAHHHRLTVVTYNVKHFQVFGIPVITPDQIAP